MSKTDIVTFEQMQKIARKNYNRGGDGIVECWDRTSFNIYVDEFGPLTYKDVMDMIGLYRETANEPY